MQPLSKLFTLTEMARPREAATWAMLDWCAQQKGDFTIRDMYNVWIKSGGGKNSEGVPGIGSFSTAANKFIAKYDPNSEKEKYRDQKKYGLSQSRPLVYSRKGIRGKNNDTNTLLQWGLSGPLRKPGGDQSMAQDADEDESPIGDALDRLEKHMGRPALKMAMQRWKVMSNHHVLAADIKKTIPPKFQMDALHVAMDRMVQSGKAEPEDVTDAEDEVEASTETPFAAPVPRDDLPMATRATRNARPGSPVKAPMTGPQTAQSTDDDDDGPSGDGWSKVPDEDESPAAAEPEDGTEYNDDGESYEDDSEAPAESDEEDEAEFPAYLPDPEEDSADKYEAAMYRLVHEGNLSPDSEIWEMLKGAKNDIDAREIIKKSSLPANLHRSALLVARAIFVNTSRDWETGAKLRGESRLLTLFKAD